MLTKALFTIFFFLPAGIGNTAPVLIYRLPFFRDLNYPLDFNLKFRGERILGSHKTVRGLVVGLIAGVLTAYLERYIYQNSTWLQENSPIDYLELSPIILGVVMAFGALLGDSVKSFFKRRVGVKPGKSWVPFDQIDYLIGAIIMSLLYVQLSFEYYILFFVIGAIAHPISTVIGYLIRVKDSPI